MKKVSVVVGVIVGLLNMVPFVQAGPKGAIGSGGGDVLLLEDNRIILADPFVKNEGGAQNCPQGTQTDLSPELKSELRLIGRILTGLGASTNASPRQLAKPKSIEDFEAVNQSDFIENDVLTAKYCFVDRLPENRKQNLKNVPRGARQKQVGYTELRTTWLDRGIFLNPRMDLREQAKTIVHERLRGALGNAPTGMIADVTNGIGVALEIYSDQQKGDRTPLTEKKMNSLKLLQNTIAKLRMNSSGERKTSLYLNYRMMGEHAIVTNVLQGTLSKNGGGFVTEGAKVSPEAYVGIGSIIGQDMTVEGGSVILMSYLCPGEFVEKRAKVQKIKKGSFINRSTVPSCAEKSVWEGGSRMTDSNLYFPLEKRDDVKTYMSLSKGASVRSANAIDITRLVLEENATLENSSIKVEPRLTYRSVFQRAQQGPFSEAYQPPVEIVLRKNSTFKNTGYSRRFGKYVPLTLRDFPDGDTTPLEIEEGAQINLESGPCGIDTERMTLNVSQLPTVNDAQSLDIRCDDPDFISEDYGEHWRINAPESVAENVVKWFSCLFGCESEDASSSRGRKAN